LLVTLDDGSWHLPAALFYFLPVACKKHWRWGSKFRVSGEIRGGFMGLTMMHPSFKACWW
jgi:ATP-dependent DNA helicase RecG